MALHFVKSNIQTAEDGTEYSSDKLANTGGAGGGKPLYMQLAEQAERRDEEYAANTKLLRGNFIACDNAAVTALNHCWPTAVSV